MDIQEIILEAHEHSKYANPWFTPWLLGYKQGPYDRLVELGLFEASRTHSSYKTYICTPKVALFLADSAYRNKILNQLGAAA
jgi:hypothetical protein